MQSSQALCHFCQLFEAKRAITVTAKEEEEEEKKKKKHETVRS